MLIMLGGIQKVRSLKFGDFWPPPLPPLFALVRFWTTPPPLPPKKKIDKRTYKS